MDIRKYFSFKKFENILFCIFNLTIGRGRQRVPMGTGVPAGIQQNFKILGAAGYRVPIKFKKLRTDGFRVPARKKNQWADPCFKV